MYYLKIALRNMLRNGLYSWINLAGLSIGVTAAMLILLWVQQEWFFDRFHADSDRIYSVVSHDLRNGNETYIKRTAVPLARAAKEELAGVEDACCYGYHWDIGHLENAAGNKCTGGWEELSIADSTFFNIFNMTFIEGDARTALNAPDAVVLSESWAKVLFGDEVAMGNIIKDNNGNAYRVTAVVRKPQEGTMLKFNALFSFEGSSRKTQWNTWTSICFLKLTPGADAKQTSAQLSEINKRHSGYSPEFPYILQPVSHMHLYAPDGSETGMKNVRLFCIIAVALLVIACINYVNLVTARMNKRGHEISLRKIIGARRFRLFLQMMSESTVLFVCALIVSQLLLFIVMPYCTEFTGIQFNFGPLDVKVLMLYAAIFVFVTLMAGIYPAIKLSSFGTDISRARTAERTRIFSLRKALVVVQFACSSALIFATITIGLQQRFMRVKDAGYMRENIFTVDMYANLKKSSTYIEALKHELKQQPEIADVSTSERNIVDVDNFRALEWDGMPENQIFTTAYMGVDRNFIEMLGMEIASGHGFTGTPADSSCFFVNETAVKQMGLTDPLNTSIALWNYKMPIAGVVKDFHFKHMSVPIGTMVMYLSHYHSTLYVKTAAGKTREAVAITESLYRKYDPDFLFTCRFLDDTFAEMYKADTQANMLFNAFAVIAILVSCLGLFGLVTFTAESKTKEIGIRKVFGASVASIVKMLSREFIVLVSVAMLIAFPVAYFWLDRMLQDYAYRINITWWMFALAAGLTVALTLLTVGWQALKAATANPVKSIKTE